MTLAVPVLSIDLCGTRHAMVYIDKNKIELVMSTLVTLAIKSTPPGGRVEVRASVIKTIDAMGFTDKFYFRIEVEDTGPRLTPV